MKVKILHLIHDDKFFDAVFDLFEDSGYENRYVILGEQRQLKYIKKIQYVEFIIVGSASYNQLYKQKIDVLFIHYLIGEHTDTIIRFWNRNTTKIVWSCWGGDFYDLIDFPLYQPITKQIKEKQEQQTVQNKKKESFFSAFVKYPYRKIYWFFNKPNSIHSAIKCIDYCSTVIPIEFDLLSKQKWFKAKQIIFNYPFPKNFSFEPSANASVKSDILIGNSYTWTNNHADVFERLKKISLGDRKMIVPLSYGTDYKEDPWLLDLGREYFGDKFCPIVDFMPLDDYNTILSGCSVAIFNSERQQALGNIVVMIIHGAKIFLSENSPVFKFFKQNNLHVFSVQSDLTEIELNSPLTLEQMDFNRYYVKNEWSYMAILSRLEKAVKQITQ